MFAVRSFLTLVFLLPSCLASFAADDVAACKVSSREGIAACSRLIQTTSDPDKRSVYLFNRALDYSTLEKNCPAAESDLKEAIRIRKVGREAYLFYRFHLTLGYVYRDCFNDPDRAIAAFTAAMKVGVGGTVSQPYLERAAAWRLKGDIRNQIDDFEAAVRVAKPENKAGVLLQRASAELYDGDFNKSLRSLDAAKAEATAKTRQSVENSVELGRARIFGILEDYDSQISTLNKAAANDPGEPDIYNNRGIAWLSKQNVTEAVRDFDRAIQIKPTARYYANRGFAWRMAGDLDKSLADLDRALIVPPVPIFVYQQRGETLRYKGRIDDAITDFDKAVHDSPDFIAAYVGRGLAYEKKNATQLALADFRKALSINGPSQERLNESRKTAQARIAALESGAPSPVIAPMPSSSVQTDEIPTPKLAPVTAPLPQATAGRTGKRIALVIGNSAYRNASTLPNPANDAAAMAASLRQIGFDSVVQLTDLPRDRFAEALRTFANDAEKADWAMVYYAGHGIEIGGVNYLIPVDAKLTSDRDVQFEAISLEQVFTSIEAAKKLRLIILDACRNNPFASQMRRTLATRSVGRGLGPVEPEGAMLVVYAAKHGQTALDGAGANSPFAVALLQRLNTPNVEISKIFRLVRDDVMEATAGRQEPFTYGSLPGREDFFFVSTN